MPYGQSHDRLFAGLGAVQNAGQIPLVHDGDAIADAKNFFQLAADDDDRRAIGGQLIDQFINLALRADVDSARRLVEDDHLQFTQQPFRQHDLLLIAAAELRNQRLYRRSLDAQLRRHLDGGLAFGGEIDQTAPGVTRQGRQRGVFAHRPARDQSQVSSVFGNQTESFAYRFLRRRDFQLFSVEHGPAA